MESGFHRGGENNLVPYNGASLQREMAKNSAI